jgi:hypothetical protein
MLDYDLQSGELIWKEHGMRFSGRGYRYTISGRIGGRSFRVSGLSGKEMVRRGRQGLEIRGVFRDSGVEVLHSLRRHGDGIKERITLRNTNRQPVEIEDVQFGMVADLGEHPGWNLCGIPFRVQLDGSLQDYTTEMLLRGEYRNAVYTDSFRREPPVREEGRLRSEAFAWMLRDKGLVVMKYNNDDIELSTAFPDTAESPSTLCFGGAGMCLYGEPWAVRSLAPGKSFSFGETCYMPFDGGLEQAFYTYRDYIEDKGHGHPEDYNPPLNWNELYDIGWFHSDTGKLMENYTREALLKEAELARECRCELLYLDPGWETAEGATIWDETRLGSVRELVEILKEEYGLDLGYRTILRSYTNPFDGEHMILHEPGQLKRPENSGPPGLIWEYCLCDPEFYSEKLRRILRISKQGIKFMMFDEMDWRGSCHDPNHGHGIPSAPVEHVKAVYRLAKEVRDRCPGLVTEVHDPVWPWCTALYVPGYFRQGFGESGSYNENWGFEYMWNCLNDLRTGRALSLYYYNLASAIPLYLHITMAADNDECLFFWWCASTVRHLGIGGKYSHKTVEDFEGGLPEYDREKRFSAYKESASRYRQLKPYFVRGKFWGLAENMHFHTLPGVWGGVLCLFNPTDEERALECTIPAELLGSGGRLAVQGADAAWTAEGLRISAGLKPMSPRVVCIGHTEQPQRD